MLYFSRICKSPFFGHQSSENLSPRLNLQRCSFFCKTCPKQIETFEVGIFQGHVEKISKNCALIFLKVLKKAKKTLKRKLAYVDPIFEALVVKLKQTLFFNSILILWEKQQTPKISKFLFVIFKHKRLI